MRAVADGFVLAQTATWLAEGTPRLETDSIVMFAALARQPNDVGAKRIKQERQGGEANGWRGLFRHDRHECRNEHGALNDADDFAPPQRLQRRCQDRP